MARMIIGTEISPFTHTVVLTLTGRRQDTPLVLARSVVVGSKAIGVFGNVSLIKHHTKIKYTTECES